MHAALPRSLEEYVQQVGRAGRDGREGRCVLLLDDADFLLLRALAHGGSVRPASVAAFLRDHVFAGGAAAAAGGPSSGGGADAEAVRRAVAEQGGRCRAAPVAALTAALDAPEEALEAALSFLQADDAPLLHALPTTAARVEVRFHRAAPKELAGAWPVVAGLLRAKARCYSGTYRAAVPALVDATGLPPAELVAQLAALAGAKEVSFDLGREQALAWKVLRPPADVGALAAALAARLARVVAASVARLDAAYAAFAGAALYGGDAAAQEAHLRGAIRDYFGAAAGDAGDGDGDGDAGDDDAGDGGEAGAPDTAAEAAEAAPAAAPSDGNHAAAASAAVAEPGEAAFAGPLAGGGAWDAGGGGGLAATPVTRPPLDQLRRAVRGFLRTEAPRLRAVGPDKLSGLAVARMLAGLGSPAFPSDAWRRVAEWGRLQAVDFPRLVAAADAELPALWDDGEGGGGGGGAGGGRPL